MQSCRRLLIFEHKIIQYIQKFRPILTEVPLGAVLSPLLLNIMLYDFPIPPSLIKKLLYVDDITIYVSVKNPLDAETILQPFIA